ncbi:hypothetical protein CK203_106890 [Vitis vinifera]|uniref:Uncharacterized protein n=1 Tax=Vitis vinifera TaxID=29760 RepID=A0A438C4V7_VITVI|nr:hypothetical protein CK203_106890 [Vitis vinifera]
MSPEAVIKWTMVSVLPIEGNSDCRARPFHFEHLMTPREFFYPRVALDFYQSMTTHSTRSPTAIHFTLMGVKGILEARHVEEALHIPYEPMDPVDFREWSPISQRDMVHILSRRTSIDSVLLPFSVEAMSYPGRFISNIRGLLFRATSLDYGLFLHFEEKDELPTESVPPAPTAPMPEATYTAPPTTLTIPPDAHSTSEASITISATEFHAMVHTFQTLTTSHTALFPADGRHTVLSKTSILPSFIRFINIMTSPPPQLDIPGPSEPIALAKETILAKETTRVDVPIQPTQEATANPSSPPEAPTTGS